MKRYLIVLLVILCGSNGMTQDRFPVPNPDHKPVKNGCVSQFRMAGLKKVPYNFSAMCDDHTECINSCGADLGFCGDKLWASMSQSCNGDEKCRDIANLINLSVQRSSAAQKAYSRAQKKACLTCDDVFRFAGSKMINTYCADAPLTINDSVTLDMEIHPEVKKNLKNFEVGSVSRTFDVKSGESPRLRIGDLGSSRVFYVKGTFSLNNQNITCGSTVSIEFKSVDCGKPAHRWRIPVRASVDPNDIIGPEGFGDGKMVSSRLPQPYTIRFENDSNLATAPAQIVHITHPLDKNVDPFSIRLGNFGFGKYVFEIPEDRTFYNTRLDLNADLGIVVDLTAGINTETREAFWIFESKESATGFPPTDVMKGFLPVNDPEHAGEGFITYTIKGAPNAATGDTVHAKASIVFDDNAPIETPPIWNTLDAGDPHSSMKPLPAKAEGSSLKLEWTGADDPEGSGIRHYDLYMSKDNGPFLVYKEGIKETFVDFNEEGGHYKFFVIATDNVGHREAQKTAAEVSVEWRPSLGCPSNKIAEPDAGVCTAVVTGIDPDRGALSSTVVISYTLSGATTATGTGSASGLSFNKGVTTVTYSANTNPVVTCSFTVTVNERAEICNNQIDDDCDGQVDEDCPTGAVLWYRDADNDGYGDINNTVLAVSKPDGYVADLRDCNDGDATVHPGATEICNNNVDDDCDGQVDEDCPTNETTWYRDADNDSYGDPNNTRRAASKPDGYVADNRDCNDNNANIHPGATEICGNNQDDDCDGQVDENCPASKTWYRDNDNDGYGDEAHSVQSADKPAGYVDRKGDCNDNNPNIHPGATEVCDGVDNNCDGRGDDCAPGLYARAMPNPSNRFFRIVMQSDQREAVTITIRNSNGKVMEVIRTAVTATPEFGANYTSGIYYAEIVQGGRRTVLKLIKLP
ncbi:putative secreted protein (Por secretion system target) [Pseudobacter ginsenosidimutans]|uniref:Putative secreted protein (Por secretion system target) n=2 Tax=Pseudobacter ginsenosidimutans TaxID=661488 RepID=A0A4Q7N339_9BACT|nr:T9SS type A sorting domain-containing protein [Pseudobacter ginsenosidimutans]RZS75514.1 putative secreted protein (Por secretion system target) [Pseudobacter ginsenosidimutans]